MAWAVGARRETLAGLAGLGDLVLTCTGKLSRNRHVGVELGRGRTIDEILAETNQVAEGVDTTRAAHALARRHDIEMPIVAEVHAVLFEGSTARAALEKSRALNPLDYVAKIGARNVDHLQGRLADVEGRLDHDLLALELLTLASDLDGEDVIKDRVLPLLQGVD